MEEMREEATGTRRRRGRKRIESEGTKAVLRKCGTEEEGIKKDNIRLIGVEY